MANHDCFSPERMFFVLVVALTCGLPGMIDNAMATPPCLTMSRTLDVDCYESGQSVVIELTLENNCSYTISSLGIVESLPDGWQFVSGEMISGEPPVQWLAPDSTDRLEIFWITVPAFPVALRYTAQAPQDEATPVVFSGYAVFYFVTGPRQDSNVAETLLTPCPEPPPGVQIIGTSPVEVGQDTTLMGEWTSLTGDLLFEWYKDEMPIPGAYEQNYPIYSATFDDAGVYVLFIEDESKMLWASPPFILEVLPGSSLPASDVVALISLAMVLTILAAIKSKKTLP